MQAEAKRSGELIMIAYGYYNILLELYPANVSMSTKIAAALQDGILTEIEAERLKEIWYRDGKVNLQEEI